jgi:hypothetical protein
VPSVCTPACTATPEIDRDLARILDAWPSLPEAIRRAILALVETSAPSGKSGKLLLHR